MGSRIVFQFFSVFFFTFDRRKGLYRIGEVEGPYARFVGEILSQ